MIQYHEALELIRSYAVTGKIEAVDLSGSPSKGSG